MRFLVIIDVFKIVISIVESEGKNLKIVIIFLL